MKAKVKKGPLFSSFSINMHDYLSCRVYDNAEEGDEGSTTFLTYTVQKEFLVSFPTQNFPTRGAARVWQASVPPICHFLPVRRHEYSWQVSRGRPPPLKGKGREGGRAFAKVECLRLCAVVVRWRKKWGCMEKVSPSREGGGGGGHNESARNKGLFVCLLVCAVGEREGGG